VTGCGAAQVRSLRPAKLLSLQVVAIDGQTMQVDAQVQLDKAPSDRTCVGDVAGSVAIGRSARFSIPAQPACIDVAGVHGLLTLRIRAPMADVTTGLLEHLLGPAPTVDVELRAARGVARIAPALQFQTAMAVQTPLAVGIANAIADRWVVIRSIRANGFSFGGIRGEVVLEVTNPSPATPTLTIRDARVTADGQPIASDGRMPSTRLRAPSTGAALQLMMAPLAGLVWLLRASTDRAVPLCAAIEAQFQVGATTRDLNISVCRSTSLLELAAALRHAMIP